MKESQTAKKPVFYTVFQILKFLLDKKNLLGLIGTVVSVIISCYSSSGFVSLGIEIDENLAKRVSLYNLKFFLKVARISFLSLFASLLADFSTSYIFHNSLTSSLADVMNYRFDKFHSIGTGDLMNRQYEKGECISKFFYSFFVNCTVILYTIRTQIIKISEKSDSILHKSLILGSIIHLVAFVLFNKPSISREKKYFDSKSKARSLVENESKNFPIVKLFNIEKTSISRVSNVLENRKRNYMSFIVFKLQKTVMYKLIELVVHFFFYYLYQKGRISKENLFSKVNLILGLFENLRLLIEYLAEISSSAYIFQHLETENGASIDQTQSLSYFDNFTLTNVSYNSVLSNINISINKNEKIAIFGPNGSGKSILINILAGLIKPDGQVLINKVPMEKINKRSLYDTLTVVFQDDYFINGTIMENLKFGNNYCNDVIIKTCQQYGTDEVFSNLKEGYLQKSSSLGEDFSGGQRQRIGFMRGVLRNTPVLLLDDCLSSINTKDKTKMVDEITRSKNRTVVIVCNEIDFLNRFDRILYIKNGTVVSTTFDEFRDMVVIQNLANS